MREARKCVQYAEGLGWRGRGGAKHDAVSGMARATRRAHEAGRVGGRAVVVVVGGGWCA